MKRDELEKAIEPIIRRCRRDFCENTREGISDEEFDKEVEGTLRPDVRRVSLMLSLALEALGPQCTGNGLEVGCGFGYLLFPMAKYFPGVRWHAVEHPDRRYFARERFLETFREYGCELRAAKLTEEPLPFADGSFSVVTFSETMEHLPVGRLNLVLDEIARVTRPGGVLLASSPNQASLENRLRLLKGKSVMDMPDELAVAQGIYGHIRLYTRAEVTAAMAKRGFTAERCVMESNNSGYRGTSQRSPIRVLHRWYERTEQWVGMLRPMADVWHIAFRKR